MSGRRLIVIGPLPPPVHGVTVSTSLVVASPVLRDRFEVEHLDTSDPRPVGTLGRWDVTNVLLALTALARLARMVARGRGVAYLPLSQGPGAFVRDSLYVHCATLGGWKVAAHLRGGEFDSFYARQGRLLRWWMRVTLSRLASMGVMGPSLRGMFDGLVAAERLAVVPNGTPELQGGRPEPLEDTVLFLSNLLARKGLLEAVEAALLVVERHPNARFLFVGSWTDEQFEHRVRELARRAGNRIEFRQTVTGADKDELLKRASVLLFPPSEPEGHPRIVLEAMAAAVPVVTTDRGAIADTVVDGETGFVLADPVPELLAQRLVELLSDPELRDRMSRAARARYEAHYTQEAADRVLADWLEAVADGRALSAA